MPARIIQANDTPFATVPIDPVTLEVIENALRNARIEMDATLVRTAMSPGIREQGDAFPLIADSKGRMIVGQFGSYIGPFLDGYDGTVEDGDLIFLNDPYSVQGAISHLNDWLVLMPVFRDGRVVAYTSMFGHMSDIGGKVPGSMPIDATSIFQEGVRIPPVKLWKQGIYNEDLLNLVMHQTRTPDWCRADLNALIAACRVASRRIIEMCERFGDDVYAVGSRALRISMIRAGLFGTMSSAILALMPLVARDLVGGDARVFGTLLAIFGLGSILGSFVSPWFRQSLSNETTVRIASMGVACGALGIAADLGLIATGVALLAAGAGTVLALSTFNVAVQMSAPPMMLARSLALYQMATFAGIALGSGVFGLVAQACGVSVALILAALFQMLLTLFGRRWPLQHTKGQIMT